MAKINALNVNYGLPKTEGTSAQVLTSNGAGSDPTWQAGGGGGILVQEVAASTSAAVQCNTIILFDDTIPQNTEGTEVITVSITPTSATNILFIEVTSWACFDFSASNSTGALFQDSTAAAIATVGIGRNTLSGTNNVAYVFGIRHRMVAGTTSSTTFKFRVGPGATADVNVNAFGNSSRRYGGTSSTIITVKEYSV